MPAVGIMEGSEGVIGDKNRSHTGKVWQSLSFEHSNDLRSEVRGIYVVIWGNRVSVHFSGRPSSLLHDEEFSYAAFFQALSDTRADVEFA